MAHLGSHWDTLRANLGALGLHLGAPGNHFGALGTVLGAPDLHFEGPGAPHGHIFSIWQRFYQIMKIIQKPTFYYGFSMISGI